MTTKRKLFKFLADRIASLETNTNVYVTHGENILCNFNKDTSYLHPFYHEESDTRMIVHVWHDYEKCCKM